ncbi:hypothetical protein G6F22_019155 [Rhizopus arrhizus]|nr:hypothetical protein G6F22_019155 [Rhizopus arrhizus]
MADGVPTDKVYPCDIDRALASLDKVKPSVDVWWNTGAQVEQMLGSGEVDMIATWVSRAQSAIANGAPARPTPTLAANSSSSRPTPSGRPRWLNSLPPA